jgi:hypothetical protein
MSSRASRYQKRHIHSDHDSDEVEEVTPKKKKPAARAPASETKKEKQAKAANVAAKNKQLLRNWLLNVWLLNDWLLISNWLLMQTRPWMMATAQRMMKHCMRSSSKKKQRNRKKVTPDFG